MDMVKNDRLFKINYDQLDYEEHSQADDELWDKLLLIDNAKVLPVDKSIKNKKKYATCTNSPGNTKTQTLSIDPKITGKTIASASSGRVLDCFENMDFTKYSGENSLLWYNLGLIEDNMDEMSQVVCHQMKYKIEKIQKTSSKLMVMLADKKQEANTCRSTSSNSKKL